MTLLRLILRQIDTFLFTPISAKGFSLMRIAWAVQMLVSFISHWLHYDLFFSLDGVWGTMNCKGIKCTVLSYTMQEPWIHLMFFALISSLVLVALGVKPRVFLAVSLVLIILFHSRNSFLLNGGNRVEKAIGFMLLLAPSMHMYSIKPGTVRLNASWIQYLLFWQLIILYSTAALRKLQVTGWLNGNKLGLSLHSEQYMRLPPEWLNFLSNWYIPLSFYTVGIQLAWLLLLIPKSWRKEYIVHFWPLNLKQTVLLGTAMMHIGIFILMEIDMFAITMLISYLGLLNEEDFAAYKRLLHTILHTLRSWARSVLRAVVQLETTGSLPPSTSK